MKSYRSEFIQSEFCPCLFSERQIEPNFCRLSSRDTTWWILLDPGLVAHLTCSIEKNQNERNEIFGTPVQFMTNMLLECIPRVVKLIANIMLATKFHFHSLSNIASKETSAKRAENSRQTTNAENFLIVHGAASSPQLETSKNDAKSRRGHSSHTPLLAPIWIIFQKNLPRRSYKPLLF